MSWGGMQLDMNEIMSGGGSYGSGGGNLIVFFKFYSNYL